MGIDELLVEILRFRDERDWKQFHAPRNLAAALSVEAGELQELMLWKTDAAVVDLVHSAKGRRRLEEEIADVLIYALLLSHEVGVDPTRAILRKLVQNAKKYPVNLSKGVAVKYSELRLAEDRQREMQGGPEERDVPQDLLFPTKPSSVI